LNLRLKTSGEEILLCHKMLVSRESGNPSTGRHFNWLNHIICYLQPTALERSCWDGNPAEIWPASFILHVSSRLKGAQQLYMREPTVFACSLSLINLKLHHCLCYPKHSANPLINGLLGIHLISSILRTLKSIKIAQTHFAAQAGGRKWRHHPLTTSLMRAAHGSGTRAGLSTRGFAATFFIRTPASSAAPRCPTLVCLQLLVGEKEEKKHPQPSG
jgi:hypothetical protein